MISDNDLIWLEDWYIEQCNGAWEHAYGIKVNTLDNPGWYVEIDLVDTSLADSAFDKIQIDRNEMNWIPCKIHDNKFLGYGGPHNFSEIISIFKSWVEKNNRSKIEN